MIEFGHCIKCGHNSVSKNYDAREDRLRYVCLGCGYKWTTPTLDNAKKSQDSDIRPSK